MGTSSDLLLKGRKMTLVEKVQKYGLIGSARMASHLVSHKLRHSKLGRSYSEWYFRNTPQYANPTPDELCQIETDLRALGIEMADYAPAPGLFQQFKAGAWFPPNYHGGEASGVWDEKLLEHWISGDLLGLWHWVKEDIYVDIAACNSPWAQVLHERLGLSTFAIDLGPVGPSYCHLPYYRSENATQTTFQDSSIAGASLQCAYEMFVGDDDQRLIPELARILKPGGKAIILPLYMHTHYCAYSTPEYFGKGYPDADAQEYVRLDCSGVPSSRKYDAQHLKDRVLRPLEQVGMGYHLRILRNKHELGQNIYCHFILEIQK